MQVYLSVRCHENCRPHTFCVNRESSHSTWHTNSINQEKQGLYKKD